MSYIEWENSVIPKVLLELRNEKEKGRREITGILTNIIDSY